MFLVNCMLGLSSPIVPYTGLEEDWKESKISLLSFSSTVLQTFITLCSGCGLMAMAGPLTCLYCLVAKRNTSLADIFRLYSQIYQPDYITYENFPFFVSSFSIFHKALTSLLHYRAFSKPYYFSQSLICRYLEFVLRPQSIRLDFLILRL